MAKDFNYDFVTPHTVVKEKNYGWKLEINKVSWNGNNPKYDIRIWDRFHKRMSKGITLSKEDLIALRDSLISMKIE